MPHATDSQIAMWRGAIALTWLDRAMHDAEKSRLLQYFTDNIVLDDTQRAQLIADLDQPATLAEIWPAITNAQDRAHLIDIAPSLFATHGAPTPAEKAAYDKMLADQMASIDMPKLRAEIQAIEANIPLERAADEATARSEMHHWGPLDNLVYHLDKMLGEI